MRHGVDNGVDNGDAAVERAGLGAVQIDLGVVVGQLAPVIGAVAIEVALAPVAVAAHIDPGDARIAVVALADRRPQRVPARQEQRIVPVGDVGLVEMPRAGIGLDPETLGHAVLEIGRHIEAAAVAAAAGIGRHDAKGDAVAGRQVLQGIVELGEIIDAFARFQVGP